VWDNLMLQRRSLPNFSLRSHNTECRARGKPLEAILLLGRPNFQGPQFADSARHWTDCRGRQISWGDRLSGRSPGPRKTV